MVCSNWALRLPSLVTAVQPSSHTYRSGEPSVIIGSMVKVMPGSSTVSARGVEVVQDLQPAVELLADAVADELAHDAEPAGGGVVLDGPADVVDVGAGAHRGDAVVHGGPGLAHQSTRRVVDLADQERGVGVAVDAVVVHGHVDVDDVAVDAAGGCRGCRGR